MLARCWPLAGECRLAARGASRSRDGAVDVLNVLTHIYFKFEISTADWRQPFKSFASAEAPRDCISGS